MQCDVYKSLRKEMTFLYVPFRTDLTQLPEGLQSLMGEMKKVITLDLEQTAQLALANKLDVIEQLNTTGYYVQLPPGDFEKETVQ